MCGIIAVVGKYRYSEIPNALIERGRDDNGIYEDDKVQLIQTRLTINPCEVKLPFQTDRYVLLYNGEVYNWKDFGGVNEYDSIIKGFEKYYYELDEHLDGQYFILIYDKATGKIYTFNDQFKIQSAWYVTHEDGLIIASNLRSFPNVKFKQEQHRGYGNVTNARIL